MDHEDELAIEKRLDALESWRAASEAVSASKRWVLPIALSVAGGVATVASTLTFILKK